MATKKSKSEPLSSGHVPTARLSLTPAEWGQMFIHEHSKAADDGVFIALPVKDYLSMQDELRRASGDRDHWEYRLKNEKESHTYNVAQQQRYIDDLETRLAQLSTVLESCIKIMGRGKGGQRITADALARTAGYPVNDR